MKNTFIYYLWAAAMLVFSLASCTETDQDGESSETLSVRTLSPTVVEAGQKLAVSGVGMDQVTTVVFSGGVSVSDIEHVGESYLIVVVPEGVENGPVRVQTDRAEAESKVGLQVANTTVVSISPYEVKTGELLSIKGADMLCVDKIIFPGGAEVPALSFVRKSSDRIEVKIPGKTAEGVGNVILKTVSGRSIDAGPVDITVVESGDDEFEEVVLWEGDFDLGNWAGNLIVPATAFAGVTDGQQIVVQYSLYDEAQFKICAENIWRGFAGAANNDWGVTDVDRNSNSMSFVITSQDLGEIAANAFCIQGKNARITKLCVLVPKPVETVVYDGPDFDIGNWAADLYVPAENFSGVSAGWNVTIEFTPTAADLQFKIIDGNWRNLENTMPNGWGVDVPQGDVSWSFVITQGDLDGIAGSGKMVLQGKNAVIGRITAKP